MAGGGGRWGGSDTRLGWIGILSKTITLIEFVLYFSLLVSNGRITRLLLDLRETLGKAL